MVEDIRATAFGPVPLHWQLARVGDVGRVQLGRARSPATDNGQNMVPYLRVANVCDGYIDYSDVYRMHFSPAEQQKSTARYYPRTSLYRRSRSASRIGRCVRDRARRMILRRLSASRWHGGGTALRFGMRSSAVKGPG
jgi:hypothetical protein